MPPVRPRTPEPDGSRRSRHRRWAPSARSNRQSTSHRPCGSGAWSAFAGPASGSNGRRTASNCSSGGVLLGVLLPQQLLGHPLTLEFLVDDRPVGHLVTLGDAGVGAGIEQPGHLIIIQLSRQLPGQPQRLGLGQQRLDGADSDLGTGLYLADRQPGGLSQSKDFSDFSHCRPLGWHDPPPKAREHTKKVEKTMRWEEVRRNVNTHSGMVNSDSGNSRKVFTLNQNERSLSTGTGVHVEPE